MKAGIFFGGGSFIALHCGYCAGPLNGVAFDRLYGVSCGSLWASLLGFVGRDKGVEILRSIKNTSDIFEQKDIFADIGDTVGRRWASIPTGFNYSPLRKLIQKYIIGVPTIPVTVYTVNLETGYGLHITAMPDGTYQTDRPEMGEIKLIGDFQDKLLSSCLVYPIVDAFLDKQNRGWIDGGFREGGPVVKALNDGASELHICLTGMYSEDCHFLGNANDVLSGVTRELEIMANQNVIGAVNMALYCNPVGTLIYQAKPQGSSEVFIPSDILENIEIGKNTIPTVGPSIQIID